MPNINIDDAYILDETGEQVDKVTGLFTKDEGTTNPEKAFAQLNIGTAGSNRNLLDNPWWGSGEVVNQRNTQSKPSNNQYTIDRWILSSGADANQWAIGANGITFTIASSGIWYTQRTPNPSAWSGKTLTASALLSDGTIKSGSAAFTYGTAAAFYNDSSLNLSMNAQGQFVLAIRSTQTIRAVKLELGSVSTLANDAPPDYGTELIKCRGYFERINTLGSSEVVGMGFGASSSSVRIGIPSLICHNINTVTYSGAGLLLEGNGTYLSISSINKLNNTPKNGFLTLTIGASGTVTPYQAYALVGTAAGGYIDISADL